MSYFSKYLSPSYGGTYLVPSANTSGGSGSGVMTVIYTSPFIYGYAAEDHDDTIPPRILGTPPYYHR